MGQILFRQPKKPLNKGFFMYSYMPPTEQEITSIDEHYWQFAVPVEDGALAAIGGDDE